MRPLTGPTRRRLQGLPRRPPNPESRAAKPTRPRSPPPQHRNNTPGIPDLEDRECPSRHLLSTATVRSPAKPTTTDPRPLYIRPRATPSSLRAVVAPSLIPDKLIRTHKSFY